MKKIRRRQATLPLQAIAIAVLLSLPFSTWPAFFMRELLALMGADEWSIEHGYRYTQWMLGGNVVIMLLFVINAVFRGAGDAAIAMRVLIVANLLNMALDPLLIFGWGLIPAMGSRRGHRHQYRTQRGCAAAVVGAAQRRSAYPRRRGATAGNLAAALNILHTSLGGIGQMLVMTAWIFLMRILASVSNEAVAGATIALRIMMFTLMPHGSLSNAAATWWDRIWAPVSRNGRNPAYGKSAFTTWRS